jgi:hypothetical protein
VPAQSVTAVAYPTLSEAATMVGVRPATLSRLPDLEYIKAGGRDHRIPAVEVIRLAQHYRRRSIDEVAFDLVAYTQAHAPAVEAAVATEVDEAVAAMYRGTPNPSTEAFLRDARRYLPNRLFRQVAEAIFSEETTQHTKPASSRNAAKRKVKRQKVAARGRSGPRSSKRVERELV